MWAVIGPLNTEGLDIIAEKLRFILNQFFERGEVWLKEDTNDMIFVKLLINFALRAGTVPDRINRVYTRRSDKSRLYKKTLSQNKYLT